MVIFSRPQFLAAIILLAGAVFPAMATIQGWHDSANSTSTSAWACDDANFSSTVQINLYEETTFIGSGLANGAREAAVGSRCGGNSNRGFSFTFPSSLYDGKTHQIYAYAQTSTGQVLLGNSPITVTFPAPAQPIRGYHESASSTLTAGWACDPNDFTQSLQISLYDNNTRLIGTTTANQPREAAVGSNCGGNSSRGWTFSFPSSMNDGQTHQIYAYAQNLASGLRQLLGNSPLAVTFPVAPPVYDANILFKSFPSVMAVGMTYYVEVLVKNRGNTTWPAGGNIKLGFYDPTGVNTWGGVNRALLPTAVAPGAQIDLVFPVQAPGFLTTATLTCQMLQEGVMWFGTQCANMSIQVIAGTAKQTLFSQSTEPDAAIRTDHDGVAPPFLVALQMNGMGAAADANANGWAAGTWTGFFPASPYSNYQRSANASSGATTAQSNGHTVGMWINPYSVDPAFGIPGGIANITLQKGLDTTFFPWCGPTYVLTSNIQERFETGTGKAGDNETYSGLAYLFYDVRSLRYVYFSIQAFDTRGAQGNSSGGPQGATVGQLVQADTQSSNYIMLTSYKDGTTWGHRTTPFIDPATPTHAFNSYGYAISKTEFETALAALNLQIKQADPACTPNPDLAACKLKLLSTHAEDYSLRNIEIGAEVHFTGGPDDGSGRLGMSVRNALISIN